jgi:hypothetical protein
MDATLNRSAAERSLEYLYEDGDRDLIAFGQVLGEVTYDVNEVRYDKSEMDCFRDACDVVDFLAGSGDFEVLHVVDVAGARDYAPFANSAEFRSHMAQLFENSGGTPSGDLSFAVWLKKRHVGWAPPRIPERIANLFGSR